MTDLVSTIWIPLLGLLLCLACSAMVEVSVDGQMVRGEYVGLVVAGSLAVGLCCLKASTPFVLLVDKIVVPALVAFAILLTVLPDTGLGVSAGASLVFVPLMFMAIYAVASTVSIRGYSRPFVAGTVLAACCLAMLVGSAVKWQGTAEDGNGPVMPRCAPTRATSIANWGWARARSCWCWWARGRRRQSGAKTHVER